MEFTFLYATRNDNYCGDSPLRMKTSLAALLQQLDLFTGLRSKTEILVVDWNSDEPLHTHPYFRDIRAPGMLKYVVVPPAIAAKYNSKGPLTEVHAYNVGARLARGKYLLRLDQDIVVGSRFLQFLETLLALQVDTTRLRPMWCSRRELLPHLVDEFVKHPVDFVNCVAHRLPLWCGKKFYNGQGAVGIFGMPTALWHDIHGYHESLTGWGHMEVEISNLFEQMSISWMNLHDVVGCEFVHIWHPVHGTERVMNEEAFPLRDQAGTWGCLADLSAFDIVYLPAS